MHLIGSPPLLVLFPLLLLLPQPAGWSNFGEVTLLTQAAYKKVLSQFMVSLRSSHSINMVSEPWLEVIADTLGCMQYIVGLCMLCYLVHMSTQQESVRS